MYREESCIKENGGGVNYKLFHLEQELVSEELDYDKQIFTEKQIKSDIFTSN